MSEIMIARNAARTAFLSGLQKGQSVLTEVPATVQVMPPRLFSGIVKSAGSKNITVVFDRGFQHTFDAATGLSPRKDDKPLRLVESEAVSKEDFAIQDGINSLDVTLRSFADSLIWNQRDRLKTDIGNAVTAEDVADIKAILTRIAQRAAGQLLSENSL